MVNEQKEDNRLIELEAIVPSGANSLFLCLARTLIYYAYKNPPLVDALTSRLDIDPELFKSDVALVYQLRIKICEYFLRTGVQYLEDKKMFVLKYSSFSGNVYDFIIQVYQLSINNYDGNQLFYKHMIRAISRLIGMNIYCKKLNGQWRSIEINSASSIIKDDDRNAPYLSTFTIYLRELLYTNQTSRTYHMLIPKKFWLASQADNLNIALRYSQFSDLNEYTAYQSKYFLIESHVFVKTMLGRAGVDLALPCQRAFCALLHKINVEQIVKSDLLVGQTFESYENSMNFHQLYAIMNVLIEKFKFFDTDSVNKIYSTLIN